MKNETKSLECEVENVREMKRNSNHNSEASMTVGANIPHSVDAQTTPQTDTQQ